jgi:ABC-type polysaccharide/polyol phosphate transport system ATPase subunit
MKTLSEMCQTGLLVHEGQLHYYDDITEAISRYNEINKQG